MFICLVIALSTIAVNEQRATPQLEQDGNVNISMIQQAGGNMEGKETQFGIAASSTWAAFTTAACNGSAFAGFNANTVFLNVSIGLVMLFVRFLPVVGTLAIAGSLAQKKKIAATAGTLSTTNAMSVFLLIFIVLLIGALSFFSALALGPLAEFFGSIV